MVSFVTKQDGAGGLPLPPRLRIMRYNDLYNMAYAHCDKFGVPVPIILISRSTKYYGRADIRREGYRVFISRYCFEHGYNFTRKTLLHEVAHVIQWELYPDSLDHGPVFRAICCHLDPLQWRSIAKEER